MFAVAFNMLHTKSKGTISSAQKYKIICNLTTIRLKKMIKHLKNVNNLMIINTTMT